VLLTAYYGGGKGRAPADYIICPVMVRAVRGKPWRGPLPKTE
jgi:hypothetical protein